MFTENVFMPDHPLFWMTGKVRLATAAIHYPSQGTVIVLGQSHYKTIEVRHNPNLALLATAYKHRGEIFDPSMADVISLRRQAELDGFQEVWRLHLIANTPGTRH